MKSILLTLCAVATFSGAQAQQYLVSGCKTDKVAVINKQGEILWQSPVKGADSNDSEITKEGNILYAYKHGARLINRNHEIIWDYPVSFPSQDLNTATQLPNGNYLIAYCANPAHIIELDAKGNVISDITYDTGEKRVHQQFRQVCKTKKNSYIIPLMSRGVIHEITNKGELIREVKVGKGPFSVQVLKNKNWLVAGGDGHYILEIDPDTNCEIRRIGVNDLPLCKLLFVASTEQQKNGNIIFANWGGHAKGRSEPCFVEFDKNNKLIHKMDVIEGVKALSSITVIDKKHYFKK